MHAAVLVVTFCFASAGAAHAQQAVVVPPQKGTAQVAVYSDGTALVVDRRAVPLPPGRVTVRLVGLSGGLRPETLQLRVEPGPEKVHVVSRRVVPGALRAAGLLRSYVGKKVSWLPDQTAGAKETEAVLLETSPEGTPTLLMVGDNVVVYPGGRLTLPQAGELPPADTLVEAVLEVAEPGERTLELDYVAKGWAWSAGYAVTAAPDRGTASFARTARITPPAGTVLPPASVRLLDGEPGSDEAQEYAVPGTVSWLPGAEDPGDLSLGKVVPALPLREVTVCAVALGAARPAGGAVQVTEAVRFDNTVANGLGVPLPAGKVSIYRQVGGVLSPAEVVSFARARPDASLQVPIRPAAGIEVVARQTNARKLNPVTDEATYEVHITSNRHTPATVLVSASLTGKWTITDHSHEFRKDDLYHVEFAVPVEGGDVVDLTCTVEYKTGE